MNFDLFLKLLLELLVSVWRSSWKKTPAEYEGGADLQFRDDFADGVCKVEDLGNVIESVMKKGALSDSEFHNMRQQVLSFSAAADDEAARTINAICSAS